MPVPNMKHNKLSSYTQLSQDLEKTQVKLHPSQVHGLLTGIICGNPAATTAWKELVLGKEDNAAAHETLQALYDSTAKELNEFLFQFQMLLLADDHPLPARAESLTLWCQGFLTGLKVTHVPIEGRDPGEMTEAIDDMIEIAKMDYEEVVESEEDEAAYVELVEYVRMAAVLIYQQLREQETAKQSADTAKHLH
jgi:yecA family protein